jgi:hypothetical protein
MYELTGMRMLSGVRRLDDDLEMTGKRRTEVDTLDYFG